MHADFCVNPVIASFVGATHSGVGACTDGSGDSRPDIWFRLTVPASGSLTIETMKAGGLVFNNTAMEVFSGDCNNLVAIACNDDTQSSDYARVELSGQTPGATLFVRIWNAATMPIGEGYFYLCAYEQSTSRPVNDECLGATAIAIQAGDCVEFNGGTDLNATSSTPVSGAPINCFGNFNEKDVWYSLEVPTNFRTNNYTFQFQHSTGSFVTIEVYIGTCNDLDFLACIPIPTMILPLELSLDQIIGFPALD